MVNKKRVVCVWRGCFPPPGLGVWGVVCQVQLFWSGVAGVLFASLRAPRIALTVL